MSLQGASPCWKGSRWSGQARRSRPVPRAFWLHSRELAPCLWQTWLPSMPTPFGLSLPLLWCDLLLVHVSQAFGREGGMSGTGYWKGWSVWGWSGEWLDLMCGADQTLLINRAGARLAGLPGLCDQNPPA